MAGQPNLDAFVLRDWERRLRKLEAGAPMNNAAIGRGGLSVYDGGMITIENGGLRVTGTAEIIGQLIASGSIFFNGPVTITGPLDITGLTQIMGDLILAAGGKFTAGTIELNPDGSAKFGTLTIDPDGTLTSGEAIINPDGSATFGTLAIDADGTLTSGDATINPDGSATFGQFDIAANGDLDSKGTLDIKGKSTLQDDLDVRNGGKIKVGGMTIDPSRFNGGVVFNNGSYLAATVNGAQLVDGNGAVTVSSNQADMGVIGGGAVIAHGGGVAVTGLPTTTEKPNVYIDSYGQLKRSTAS